MKNQKHTTGKMELTILMPCLNEAETLAVCIKKASHFLKNNRISGEVLVSDNGSTDGSVQIAKKLGARVVHAAEKGYGSALMAGISAAKGRYIIMGDADQSYDFGEIMPFVEKLREGFGLVMGNRFLGGIKKGAMPLHHKYLGNPVLTGIGRLFFRTKIGDFHCGLRGFSKEAIASLGLNTAGMEFASEMVVKAVLHKTKITEVPVTLYPDGRSRPPHLRSFRDGWRHLKFLLMFSPDWLFLYPGIALTAAGLLGTAVLAFGQVRIGHVFFDVHTMLFCVLMVVLGVQTISFSLIVKSYASKVKLYPVAGKLTQKLFNASLDKGMLTGALLFAAGLVLSVAGTVIWARTGFGELTPASMLRILLPAFLSMAIGWQILFTSFVLGIIQIKTIPRGG